MFGNPATICQLFAKKSPWSLFVAAFNVSTETFWQKFSIFEESLNLCFFFILLSIVFPQGCQSHLLRVQRTILSCSIGTYSALSSDFGRKRFELFSKKLYHCSQNSIHKVGSVVCEIFGFFGIFLVSWFFSDPGSFFVDFGKTSSAGLLKL